MSNFIKTTKDIKNKKGNVIEKVLNIQPKKGTLTINEINNLYKKMKAKTNTKNIMIKVVAIDGFKTLKSFGYNEDNLDMLYEDYYSSLPKDTKNKFDKILAVQIITR